MHVAGRDHGPGRRDADLRFQEVFVGKTHRSQHGPGGRGFDAVDHLGGVLAQIVVIAHDDAPIEANSISIEARQRVSGLTSREQTRGFVVT
ncbi:hypothetical protein D3C73_1349680 [compost metagenome]